ncbi:MAG: hypothetical protein AAGC65_15785 [Mucilaginibacter sp.]|uniref:hypothetical protein n=1 Tax=Mucilaginibacter sp. TaxID=1882438 RepID=UPI0031AB32E7
MTILKQPLLKIISIYLLFFITLPVLAQDKTKTIGNKLSSNDRNNGFGIVQGGQVGIKMNAGSKPVELLKLRFHVDNQSQDTIPFKVNVYNMPDNDPQNNLVKDEVRGTIIRNNKPENQLIIIDLSPYNIKVKGNILVSVEFLKTEPGKSLGFACGLLNGGTYYKSGINSNWAKRGIVGADFNVLVKKLNLN